MLGQRRDPVIFQSLLPTSEIYLSAVMILFFVVLVSFFC